MVAGAAGAQGNLGFETAGRDALPAHWEIVSGADDSPAAFDVAVDATTAVEGERSLRIRQTEDAAFVRIAQRVALAPAPARAGARKLRLSAAVLGTESARAGSTVWLRISGTKGSMFVDSRGDAREVRFEPASSETAEAAALDAKSPIAWRRYVLELPLPDDAEEAVLGAAQRGRGTAWFDDFRIDVVAAAGPPPSAAAVRYIDAALEIVREHALNGARVDWPRVRSATLEHARGARAPGDTYGPLRYALHELGDQHSYLLAPSSAKALATEPVANARTGRAAVEPLAKLIAGRFAYLAVPGFVGGTPADQVRFASGLQEHITALDISATCGWILDLRNNSGGNLWPMLAGTGPLLGEGDLGASVYPDGTSRPFSYLAGEAGFGDYVQLRVVAPHRLAKHDVPLALLLGPRTASSAEVLATAVRGRPLTRSFGAPTSGVSAGNRTFELQDGAALVLTVAATADRTGHVQIGPITPDERVDAEPRDGAGADAVLAGAERPDPVLAAAMTWLESQPPCR